MILFTIIAVPIKGKIYMIVSRQPVFACNSPGGIDNPTHCNKGSYRYNYRYILIENRKRRR